MPKEGVSIKDYKELKGLEWAQGILNADKLDKEIRLLQYLKDKVNEEPTSLDSILASYQDDSEVSLAFQALINLIQVHLKKDNTNPIQIVKGMIDAIQQAQNEWLIKDLYGISGVPGRDNNWTSDQLFIHDIIESELNKLKEEEPLSKEKIAEVKEQTLNRLEQAIKESQETVDAFKSELGKRSKMTQKITEELEAIIQKRIQESSIQPEDIANLKNKCLKGLPLVNTTTWLKC